eukprot:COSAG01_NODE_44114_length_422_cov_1.120743_2_plen_27_part_01
MAACDTLLLGCHVPMSVTFHSVASCTP